ncbi:hypothetical protein B0H19DRAFT_1066139 [Mycena capillaripes]|nr:hypothetical protein B0H19DRAFT_1066139 [Mycena capillaripes]
MFQLAENMLTVILRLQEVVLHLSLVPLNYHVAWLDADPEGGSSLGSHSRQRNIQAPIPKQKKTSTKTTRTTEHQTAKLEALVALLKQTPNCNKSLVFLSFLNSTYPQYNWQPRRLGAEPHCVELLLAVAGNCLWDCVEPFKNFEI